MLIVSGFSAFVDWRKEKEFVLRANEEKDGKEVSFLNFCPQRRYDFEIVYQVNVSIQIRSV